MLKVAARLQSPVDDVDADGGIDVVGEGVLADEAAADGEDVGRVEPRVHRGGLARVDHEEDLVVAPLRPHLLEGVRQLHVGYLF